MSMQRWFLFFSVLCLSLLSGSAHAQEAEPTPELALTVSMTQVKMRVNDRVQAVVLVANQSDVPVSGVQLAIHGPEFLEYTPVDCSANEDSDGLELGPLTARAVTTQPLCITLDARSARAGAFNLLFVITYMWGEKVDLVTAEKSLEVDLIGSETILGIPLAFAGIILPGLMLLIALRWFELPWAVKLTAEDRLIYGVLISLILLGPFSWLSSRAAGPVWFNWFDFSQQVSIERLAVFILTGLGVGTVIGSTYRAIHNRREAERAALRITDSEELLDMIYKVLMHNPRYQGGQVIFRHKQSNHQILGMHYAEAEGKLYMLGKFRLIANQLDAKTRQEVERIINARPGFGADGARILSIVKILRKRQASQAVQLADPVIEMDEQGRATVSPNLAYKILNKDEYQPPTLKRDNRSVLLDAVF